MPRLTNARWEKVAQEMAAGRSIVDAYASAGYKPNRSHASRLVADGNVRARVEELQAMAAEKLEITKERITQMLFEDRDFAISLSNPAVARAASVDIGRLHGFSFADREKPEEPATKPQQSGENVVSFPQMRKEFAK